MPYANSADRRSKANKSNTLGIAVVDCLFRAASGAKSGFESELSGVVSPTVRDEGLTDSHTRIKTAPQSGDRAQQVVAGD